jgi:hypothetical protein
MDNPKSMIAFTQNAEDFLLERHFQEADIRQPAWPNSLESARMIGV